MFEFLVFGSMVLTAGLLYYLQSEWRLRQPDGHPRLSEYSSRLFRARPAREQRSRAERPPTESTRLERLELVAHMVNGAIEHERSSVSGHVTWSRSGYRYYYFEQAVGGVPWGILAARLPSRVLPSFQVRSSVAPCPFPGPSHLYLGGDLPDAAEANWEVRAPSFETLPRPPLDGAGWEQLLALATVLPSAPMLEAHGARARVCLPVPLLDLPDPARVLVAAERLLDLVLERHAPAPDEVAAESIDVLAHCVEPAVSCPVCAEAIAETRVECARCGAPHHPECWTYSGGCAIYACEGREQRA